MAEEDDSSKSRVKDIRKRSKFHTAELGKLSKQESKILKDKGYEEKSHKLIWILIIIVIIVALLWFFFAKRIPVALRIPLSHP